MPLYFQGSNSPGVPRAPDADSRADSATSSTDATQQITAPTAQAAEALCALAVPALRRMYCPDDGLFAFRLRRRGGRDCLEGHSVRYSAIAILGLDRQHPEVARFVLHGVPTQALCGRLIEEAVQTHDLGAAALTLWAARVCEHADQDRALEALKRLDPLGGDHPTVELAWCLSALTHGALSYEREWLAGAVARRLMRTLHERSGVFAHHSHGSRYPWHRAHVSCFADFVYPIQALARHYGQNGCTESLRIARRCAETMCQLQGADGQWWWHFDVRTGQVIERYPVYAIHQDAMGPMALLELAKVCDFDPRRALQRSLSWLENPPEIQNTLIDAQAGVVWRKVCRNEPAKLSRGLQAAASRLHARLRVPGIGGFFHPNAVDAETRPYHMGWMLYAWGLAGLRVQPRLCTAELQGDAG